MATSDVSLPGLHHFPDKHTAVCLSWSFLAHRQIWRHLPGNSRVAPRHAWGSPAPCQGMLARARARDRARYQLQALPARASGPPGPYHLRAWGAPPGGPHRRRHYPAELLCKVRHQRIRRAPHSWEVYKQAAGANLSAGSGTATRPSQQRDLPEYGGRRHSCGRSRLSHCRGAVRAAACAPWRCCSAGVMVHKEQLRLLRSRARRLPPATRRCRFKLELEISFRHFNPGSPPHDQAQALCERGTRFCALAWAMASFGDAKRALWPVAQDRAP